LKGPHGTSYFFELPSDVEVRGVPKGVSDGQQEERAKMATGTVKWFNDSKGFGFIVQDGGGEDVFCHHTSIQMDGFRTLAEGQKVSFDLTKGPKGLQAQNVKAV
jgi:cold shock protein